MLNALIDVTRLLHRRLQGRLPTGVDRVSLEYVRHFGACATALVRYAGLWIELNHRDSARVFAMLLSSDAADAVWLRWAVVKAMPASIGERYLSPRFLFNTGHSGLEQADYAYRLQRSGLKPLFFVHDLIPLLYPEYCRPGESGRHKVRMDTLLNLGYGIIANSAATLDELAAYAHSHALPLPPAVVSLLAPARLPAPSPEPPLSRPYFVMLGTIEPRKNHWLMLQLWRQLIETLGAKAPRLVIIGQRGWECENVVDLLERCETLADVVFEYPSCSDAELASWLHHAQALLFPTFAEGFGMPLVEALGLGVPVIASDLPVFREIAGTIPEYADPLDGKRWKQLILDYSMPDSPARQHQCQRMSGFAVPTWDSHFAQVEALMASLSAAK